MILLGVGAVCLGLFLGFWLWHSPARKKLTQPEIDHYLGAIERQVFLPEDDKPKALARLRAWAEADDGRPFYMLNLMRYYPELRRFQGNPELPGHPRTGQRTVRKKGKTAAVQALRIPPAGREDAWEEPDGSRAGIGFLGAGLIGSVSQPPHVSEPSGGPGLWPVGALQDHGRGISPRAGLG